MEECYSRSGAEPLGLGSCLEVAMSEVAGVASALVLPAVQGFLDWWFA